MKTSQIRKPDWLKIKLPNLEEASKIIGLLNQHSLNTICSSGLCPNRGECWGHGTATFMICGDVCTRACRFCAVKTGNPRQALDEDEKNRIITTIRTLKLRHVVLTSVDRDDLPDGGSRHWVNVIKSIKENCEGVTIEALIPDFQGNTESIQQVIDIAPDVISHNMETVRRLTSVVRSVATYEGSLGVIKMISQSGIRSKSGIMLGLGEALDEIFETMDDLRECGCEVLTVGQYLQPTPSHIPVEKFWSPDEFDMIKREGLKRGFRYVESGPFVRSSFHAECHVE